MPPQWMPGYWMGLTLDQWLMIIAPTGIALFLYGWWEMLRGTEMPRPRLNWLMRYGGFVMILIPLGLQWNLSESWILGLSLLIVVYGLMVKTLKKTG